MVDVHQIHLELVLRLGVVAAIDLRISRQTRFDLQPQIECGQFLTVLLGNLRALPENGYASRSSMIPAMRSAVF